MKASVATVGLSDAQIREANTQSKTLIGLGPDSKPLLHYLLMHAKKAGYKNVCLIVSLQNKDQFQNSFGNQYLELNISYAIQYIPEGRSKPMGTADAVQQALDQHPHLKQSEFTVCNSDNLYSIEALNALRETEANNAFIAYDRDGLKFSEERISRFALAKLNSENHLEAIIEKPEMDQISTFMDALGKLRVSMNIFKLSGPEIYSFLVNCPIHPERNEKELPSALLNMCNSQEFFMLGIPMNEHVPDLTSKEDIAILKQYLENNE